MDEILMKAAQEMDRRGWCKGRGVDRDGKVCLYGAVAIILYPNTYGYGKRSLTYVEANRIQEAMKPLAAYVNQKLDGEADFHPVSGLFYYNDTILQTKEEAVKTLMEAAEYSDLHSNGGSQ